MASGRPDYQTTVYGTVAITGAVTVTGTVAISGTVTVTGAVTVTGSVTVSGTVAISGTVTVSGAVTVTGTVSITGTVTITGAVTVTGTVTVSGTVAISGTVTVTGAVTVTGTVAISGTVTISGSVSITGSVTISGAVTITSGAVTITTSGGTNIIIDKLLQDAYTGRNVTISNDNGVGGPTAPPQNLAAGTYRGKYYPRGCRGFLGTLAIYCIRTGAGTVTLSYAPQPGIGAVGSVTITPTTGWNWGAQVVKRFWNYDSLFVWISACSADVSWGYEDIAVDESLESSDSGVTWLPGHFKLYARAAIQSATVGDLPVSGTVNNVPIPGTASLGTGAGVNVPGSSTATILTINGAGYCDLITYEISAAAASDDCKLKIECDGVEVFNVAPVTLNAYGFGSSSPGISLGKFTTDGICALWITHRWEFRRSLVIKAEAVSATAQTVEAGAYPNLIK